MIRAQKGPQEAQQKAQSLPPLNLDEAWRSHPRQTVSWPALIYKSFLITQGKHAFSWNLVTVHFSWCPSVIIIFKAICLGDLKFQLGSGRGDTWISSPRRGTAALASPGSHSFGLIYSFLKLFLYDVSGLPDSKDNSLLPREADTLFKVMAVVAVP